MISGAARYFSPVSRLNAKATLAHRPEPAWQAPRTALSIGRAARGLGTWPSAPFEG